MHAIDLNCDLGEGCGNDDLLLEFVSSANIACGYHAGDADTMRRTAEAAARHGVAIGAHPGYPDRYNFGRTEMQLSSDDVFRLVTDQIADMKAICDSIGCRLNHVKPHGALYNQAARDIELASVIAGAVKAIDEELVLYGLAGGKLIEAAALVGLGTASEAFADRTYSMDGRLTPRSQPNALIMDPQKAVEQVLMMIERSEVSATDGSVVRIKADTICLHGDGEHAVEFARAIRTGLIDHGVTIMPIATR